MGGRGLLKDVLREPTLQLSKIKSPHPHFLVDSAANIEYSQQIKGANMIVCTDCQKHREENQRLKAEVEFLRRHQQQPPRIIPLTCGGYLDNAAPISSFLLGASLGGGSWQSAAKYLPAEYLPEEGA